MKKDKTILVILDGWGSAAVADDNAVALAHTPNFDALMQKYPHTEINTSGMFVGLPQGQMGNSEVGHMNIGAGRVVYQSLTRIQKALDETGFLDNAALLEACDIAKDKALHLIGLLSPGGVHSHENHIEGVIKLAKDKGVSRIYLHAILDGRDMPPQSAEPSLRRFMALEDAQFAIKTVVGRYYAMDRDNNWARVEAAYQAITENQANWQYQNPMQALEAAYARGEHDEFVQASVIFDPSREIFNQAHGVEEGDSVVMLNFRADRARQLAHAFVDKDFSGFNRKPIALSHFVTMTQYQADLPAKVAFAPERLRRGLGEVIANEGLHQLRIAETEKYAHVTYFFNGGEETVFANEDRILVKSPAVATYDLQPEMSAPEVTEKLVAAILSKQYDFICVNFANPDMVGHSGVLAAAIKAVEAVDIALGKVVAAAQSVGMKLLITADHGNVEEMINKATGAPLTSHTTNPVPLILVSDDKEEDLKAGGALCDLAPTVLDLMGIEKPIEMTGQSLLERG